MMTVLVIGGGHAGAGVVAGLRQRGFDGRLIMVSAEPELPYQRPPLSKGFLTNEVKPEQMLLRPEAFYAKHNIDLMLDCKVTSIDTKNKTVTLSDGSSLGWHELILACGSEPRRLSIPGAGLANIFYMRTLADSSKIRAALDNCQVVTIVGGGYIGLEVAASARKANKQVTVLEMEDRILQRVTSVAMSAFYHSVHESHGVTIHTNTTVAALAGENGVNGVEDGVVTSVQTASGDEFPTDVVIIGVGVSPAIGLAEAAGVECNNGILVDERCRTSVPHIWAIGDCTNHPNRIFNRRLRLESVPNATDQARVVAANLTGSDKTHDAVPWFWSDQYDLKLQMAGFSAGADTEVLRGNEQSQKFARFYWKDSVLTGVDAVNCPQEFMLCRKLLEAGVQVEPNVLADQNTDLKSLLSP